jgi:hypothetical protein
MRADFEFSANQLSLFANEDAVLAGLRFVFCGKYLFL